LLRHLLILPLQLRNISFRFTTERNILSNVSLTLAPGESYVLMGSNGAGKTTLFNLVTGFLKPQSGSVVFEGKELTGKPPYQISRTGIGRSFQDLRLISSLTVRDNIILAMPGNPTDNWLQALLPRGIHKPMLRQLGEKADRLAAQFFLQDVQQAKASDISYGQQKLLSLACCVATGARLLLLDEPVAGIQPAYRDQIASIIRRLKDDGKTILMIEHNTEFIEGVAGPVLFLHEAIITPFDHLRALRQNDLAMEAYF
jgi:ABC-type branched-subunit amino acid transport system ATPase component